eukprot:CAMPEP_0119107594 /NCGR_PEP_ID=MMETSP1180-20130426/11496_1 /TAXON_ID=3052 ORGANISM="Chlamydomonas cf sp, Strain CCMP681" /NCGR_SAMPLE_ID=MMETSP1180 /ASSEMBLY_ACC=CAM_ASM_000741 /LENGTH=82 /DNA_ID=CAMNT_0007093109 /DNA_START=1 /DNA_END=246 /DNA_ORIENTATION=+
MPQHNASINRQASGGASRPQATVSTGWRSCSANMHSGITAVHGLDTPEALLACVASLRQILKNSMHPDLEAQAQAQPGSLPG